MPRHALTLTGSGTPMPTTLPGTMGLPKNPPGPRTQLDALTSVPRTLTEARTHEFPPGPAEVPVRDLRSRESLLRLRGVGASYRAVGFK